MSVKNISTINKKMLSNMDFAAAVKSDIQRICGNGQFFTAVFYKQNGELRQMNCRLGVKKHFRTPGGVGKTSPEYPNRLTVWDRDSCQYRTISLDRLERLTMAGKTVVFK